jgi:hypothetical protein
MLETVSTIIGIVLVLGPIALVIRKAGYSPFWVLLAFVPLVNVAAIFYFVLSEWPIERELKQLTPYRKSRADAQTETAWELKQLANRVALIEQLAASDEKARQVLNTTGKTASEYVDETLGSLEKFIKSAGDENDKRVALNLLETTRHCDGRIQAG